MKVILLQNIKALGNKGDIKEVAEGYARNFLFPRKLAQAATESGIKNIEAQKAKEREGERKNIEKMRLLADTLKEKEIVLKSKEKNGKLFGSISKKDIAGALGEKRYGIKENNIILSSPIKNTGEYKIEIKLDTGIFFKINLKVEGQ